MVRNTRQYLGGTGEVQGGGGSMYFYLFREWEQGTEDKNNDTDGSRILMAFNFIAHSFIGVQSLFEHGLGQSAKVIKVIVNNCLLLI